MIGKYRGVWDCGWDSLGSWLRWFGIVVGIVVGIVWDRGWDSLGSWLG